MNALHAAFLSIRPLVCGLVLGVALSGGAALAQTAPAGKGSDEMMRHMMSGMEGMKQMTMSGDVDRDFAMMMKMHHQQAIDMAKVELAQGKSEEMKKLARKIIDDQTKEIAQLDKWLKRQK